MYIARVKREYRARPYYYLRDSDNTVLISLGHTRNLERAYGEAMREYLKASQRLQAFEYCLTSHPEPHSVPKATVQWQLKRIPQLIREAALVCYGVELPDLYVQMVLSGQMSFRDAVADFKSHDSEYAAQARVRH